MPIPVRLRVTRPSERELREFCALCNQIEDGVLRSEDVRDALAKWNARANRAFEPGEFTTYYGAVSMEEFVEDALLPTPAFIEDATFDELQSVLEELMAARLAPPLESYFLALLDRNLPGADVNDLIYWPNQWFGGESLPEVELSAEQILTYASLRSGRSLAGAPTDVPLPYQIPNARRPIQFPEQH